MGEAPKEDKCVILGVPHTSILDFVISMLYYHSLGHEGHTMIKKELFFWPLGPFLRAVGCIPVDRKSGAATIRSVMQAMNEAGQFHLCIAPEGTRKPVKKWKMGYHKIATELNLPVYLAIYDWGRKEVGVLKKFELTDDARKDTEAIQAEYEKMGLVGRHPEGYCTH